MAYRDDILATSGLLRYWRQGEASGATMVDETGAGNGTYTSTPVYGAAGALTGDSDTAITYDGSADAASAAVNLSTFTAVTLEFWLKVTSWLGADQLAFEYTANYNSSTGGFIVNPNESGVGRFQVGMTSNSGVSYETVSFTRPSTGVFHHYVVAMDRALTSGNQIVVYMDGAAPTLTHDSNVDITGSFVNSTLYFMSRATTSLRLAGTLDEVALYSGAMSLATAQGHYDVGVNGPSAPADNTTKPALPGMFSPQLVETGWF